MLLESGPTDATGEGGTTAQRWQTTGRGPRPATRYAFWLGTSDIYSGGRIHLYQLAWCLASRGASVDLYTDRDPVWARDYPALPRLRVHRWRDTPPGDGPDVIFTDGREPMASVAVEMGRRHPHARLVGMSFETRDWFLRFASPSEAPRFIDRLPLLSGCDLLLAASAESARWLHLELRDRGLPEPPIHPFEPGVNSFALSASRRLAPFPARRPYALMVGRPAEHKNWAHALDAVWALDVPFDLVAFGRVREDALRPDTPLHALRIFDGGSDVEKFRAMQRAAFVLAPSTFEGCGMVPAEALCCGVPCVAYDLPVLRQVYGDRLRYVPWNDARALADAVARLVAEPEPGPGSRRDHLRRHGLAAQRRRVEALPLHGPRRPEFAPHPSASLEASA